MYLRKYLFLIGAVSLGSSVALLAADNTESQAKVLNDLHHSNQMEIQMGQLAQKNGSSDAIKKFGDTLVADHTDMDQKVTDVAKSQGVTLTDMTMSKEDRTMTHLTSLQGSEFDRAFAQAMVDGHRKDIKKLQAAQPKIVGTPTGDLVTTSLPIIQKHEQIASDFLSSIHGSD